MNNRMLIIIGIAAGLIVAGLVVWLLVLKNQPPKGLTIPGNNQQSVNTGDFITPAPVKHDRAVVLYFDSDFSIQFDTVVNSFQITFNSSDIQQLKQLRTKAEGVFLSKVGINQSDACKLKVTEAIQPSPAVNLNNYVYSLSFCTQNDNFPN